MTRVSPPEDDREFPGPHASIRVTLAPRSRRCRAVHPPKAPAPMTAMWGLDFKGSESNSLREEDSRKSRMIGTPPGLVIPSGGMFTTGNRDAGRDPSTPPELRCAPLRL